MNIIAISSSAWHFYLPESMAILERFIEKNTDEFVLISEEIVKREKLKSDNVYDSIELRTFLDFGHNPDGILDVHQIRKLPFKIQSDKVVVINAAASRSTLIEQFLYQCRHGWYELDDWHPAFILIVDESILLSISNSLANTFYIQPDILTEPELRAKVRSLMRAAKILHYFGHKIGRLHRWILVFNDRLEQRKAKKDIDI
jgi:hypothetical protein